MEIGGEGVGPHDFPESNWRVREGRRKRREGEGKSKPHCVKEIKFSFEAANKPAETKNHAFSTQRSEMFGENRVH